MPINPGAAALIHMTEHGGEALCPGFEEGDFPGFLMGGHDGREGARHVADVGAASTRAGP